MWHDCPCVQRKWERSVATRQLPRGTGTSYVLYAYLYCIYTLVGGAISDLNPLSSKYIIESCVMPVVLLFGCENWILSEICLYTGGIPWRTCQENLEVANEFLQYLCNSGLRDGNYEIETCL